MNGLRSRNGLPGIPSSASLRSAPSPRGRLCPTGRMENAGGHMGPPLSRSFANPAKSPEENYGFLWSAGERFPKERTVEIRSAVGGFAALRMPYAELVLSFGAPLGTFAAQRKYPAGGKNEASETLTTAKKRNPVRSFRIGFFPACPAQQIIHTDAIKIRQFYNCIQRIIQNAKLIL